MDDGAGLARLLAQDPADKEVVRAALDEARRRTWLLVEGLTEDVLGEAAASYLSPPVWDLGHMANFEELWLVQRLGRVAELHAGYNDTYDAFAHPRPERPALHLLDREGCRRYMEEVRQQALRTLDEIEPGDGRLLEGLFVYWMLVLHEHQHQETLLQTIQMQGRAGRYEIPGEVRRLPRPARPTRPSWCDVPAGRYPMGRPHGPCVYDNEAPPHEVEVGPFQVAATPVTCGDYLAFVRSGGYDGEQYWSERGRQWLAEEPHHAPLYWAEEGGEWVRYGIGCRMPVAEVADEILAHITHFEAEAYAAWAGARLPTEVEWEVACRGPDGRRNPWGDEPATTRLANVDQLAFAPSAAGAFPGGASWCGAEHMIGDVWEWTSSGFEPYDGFGPFPYDEYSKVFFGGDYKVLRGGSWATRAACATGTFRNWDHPYRRQIFAGVRLARDA